MTTPKLQMPELVVGQAGKELTHNQALAVLDQLAQAVVVDKDLTAPPGSPANGSMYIVAAGATGAWSGMSGKLAYWLTTVADWAFITPEDGWMVWVTDEGKRYERVSGAWSIVASGGAGPGDMLSTLISSEVSITGATTLTASAFGKMHICTGTSADYTVGLPAVSGNSGKFIGFRMSPSLTKFVTLDANATELIDGAQSRAMWKNEVAILLCDGSAWTKVGGKTVPMVAEATRTAVQSISMATVTTIDLTATTSDSAGLVDLTTDRISIKRSGTYLTTFATVFQFSGSGTSRQSRLDLNGVNLQAAGPDYGQRVCRASFPQVYASGDYLQLSVYQNNGTEDAQASLLSIVEVPDW